MCLNRSAQPQSQRYSDIYLSVLRLSILPEAFQQFQSAEGKVRCDGSIVASPAPQLTGHLDRSSRHSVKKHQNDWMLWRAAGGCKTCSVTGLLPQSFIHVHLCLCKKFHFLFLYLRWESGQALAKPTFKWWKSLSLNILSLKKPSSRKNTCDT